MAAEIDLDRDRIRMLMKRYRIIFKDPTKDNEWPSVHRNNFENVRKIRDQSFDNYSATVNIRSSDEPWRERTKHQAKWLTKRACGLFSQQRNESGWRLGLENDVLRRFSVEVACPKCRARLWRSEIEASIGNSDDLGGHLDERRKNRLPCRCPPHDRPQDFYEVGTNLLFDDRSQERILHDPLIRSELPNKEPDRVYGLTATKNFETLLSADVPNVPPNDGHTSLGQTIRSCPFKDVVNPLLFPFLILEVKSEKSKDGFDDILTQTAFPILALLQLQADLHEKVPGREGSEALVWFLANRGDVWRVYGCCVTNSNPVGYNIFQLWDGSIMNESAALQLLLIVDYIFDWARDIYRPSILRQLKSLATSKAYDEVSMTSDSDIMSVRDSKLDWDWLQPAPGFMGGPEPDQPTNQPVVHLDHASLLIPMHMPNTPTGTIRSARLINSHVIGLYITEHNVEQLLKIDGPTADPRKLVNFLTRWDELFILTGEDIDNLEEIWTGETRYTDGCSPSSQDAEFYVVMEVKTFIDGSWNIVRELTYLAISKPAFEILVDSADYTTKHQNILSVSAKARSCSRKVLNEALRCLRSGSPSQIFLMAIACTSLSLYQLPTQRRSDFMLPTEAIGVGEVKTPQLLLFLDNFRKLAVRKRPQKNMRIPARMTPKKLFDKLISGKTTRPKYELSELSFVRQSDNREMLSEDDCHEAESCERCRSSGRDIHRDQQVTRDQEVFSAYGMSLVVSLIMSKDNYDRHELCLFVVESLDCIDNGKALSVVVEDLLQRGYLYHTIRHHIPSNISCQSGHLHKHDRLWNLPLPYRPAAPQERRDFMRWLDELQGMDTTHSLSPSQRDDCWDTLQLLMQFLERGMTWKSTNDKIEHYRRKDRRLPESVGRLGRGKLFDKIVQKQDDEDAKRAKERGTLLWLPKTICAKGDQ